MSRIHKKSDLEYPGCGIDKHGRVFKLDGIIYRALKPAGKRIFDHINTSGAYQHLVDVGLISSEMTDMSLEHYSCVLKHKKIKFISFCQEWSFTMLKQAAILQCNLTKELLSIGLTTKDAHPWNIAFDFTRPVFIDFGSITFAGDANINCWISEFKMQFYLPLWLAVHRRFRMCRWAAKEHPIGPIKRIMCQKRIFSKALVTFNRLAKKASKQNFPHFLDLLIEHLESMDVSACKGKWSDYEQGEWKSKVVVEVLQYVDAKSLIDLATNKGEYSTLAADMGLSVVAIDVDEYSIEYLYESARCGQKTILPLILDVLRPTPPFAIGLFYESSYERLRCDIGFALAIVHHLVFKSGIDFRTIATIISRYVHRYALVEFIPPDDKYVSEWIRGHEAKYDWYTEEQFVSTFLEYFDSFKDWHSPADTRKLYLFERKR